MISVSDLIKLPFTPDLTEGGIHFATRSLGQNYDHSGGSVYARLRNIVGSVAVELAFRRYLSSSGIPFAIKGTMPFSEPDHYDVLLGGRRCNIHTYLTTKRSQITNMRGNPAMLLKAPATIPEEQLSTNLSGKDLQIFTFLFGLTTNSPEDISKAINANQPVYLVHPLPAGWAHPQIWAPLGKLGLKSESGSQLNIEIGGLDIDRNFITETLSLQPLKRAFAKNNYYSLAYMHTERLPNARVGIQSPNKSDITIIQPHEWDNIWVYGLEIWLAGYLVQEEFRNKASTSFAGSRIFQYSKTQTKKLSVPVTDLRALKALFDQVTNWEIERKNW